MKQKYLKLDWKKFGTMSLDERRAYFIEKYPNFLKLEKKLFKMGGKRLIYMPEMEPTLCEELISNGVEVSPTDVKITGDEECINQCHSISLGLKKHFGADHYEGYALHDDGYWRHHSWVKYKGEFLEVTPVERTLYFGVHRA